MTDLPDNPSAFPVSTIDGFTSDGMTLRDWFAGQAAASVGHFILQRCADAGGYDDASACAMVSRASYDIADAMLAKRAQVMSARQSQDRNGLGGEAPPARSAEPMRPDTTGGTQ